MLPRRQNKVTLDILVFFSWFINVESSLISKMRTFKKVDELENYLGKIREVCGKSEGGRTWKPNQYSKLLVFVRIKHFIFAICLVIILLPE